MNKVGPGSGDLHIGDLIPWYQDMNKRTRVQTITTTVVGELYYSILVKQMTHNAGSIVAVSTPAFRIE
jgi:hypothetical protein